MRPHVFDDTTEERVVEDILMYCQLPLPMEQQVSTYPPNSDAYMAYRLLIRNHKKMLTDGMWFNTQYNHSVPIHHNYYQELQVPDFLNSSPKILKVENTQNHNYDCTSYTKYVPSGSANIIQTQDGEVPLNPGHINYMWAVPLENCPGIYIEYITLKTAEDLGKLIGIVVDPDLVATSWHDLMSHHYREQPTANLYEPNYAH